MHRITQRHAKLQDGSSSLGSVDADAKKYGHGSATRYDRGPLCKFLIIPVATVLLVAAVAMYNITYIKGRTQTLTRDIHLGSIFAHHAAGGNNTDQLSAVGLLQWFVMSSDKKLKITGSASPGAELMKAHPASPRSANDDLVDSSHPPKHVPLDFNWKMYLSNYEDLRGAGLKTQEGAEEHYMHTGYAEHRIYNELLVPQLLDFNTTDTTTKASPTTQSATLSNTAAAAAGTSTGTPQTSTSGTAAGTTTATTTAALPTTADSAVHPAAAAAAAHTVTPTAATTQTTASAATPEAAAATVTPATAAATINTAAAAATGTPAAATEAAVTAAAAAATGTVTPTAAA